MELNLNYLLWDAIMNLCATGENFDHWNFSLVLRVEINNVQFNGDLYSHGVCILILYHTEQLTIKKYFFTRTSAIKLEFYLYISLGTIFLLPSPLCEKYVAWGDQATYARLDNQRFIKIHVPPWDWKKRGWKSCLNLRKRNIFCLR